MNRLGWMVLVITSVLTSVGSAEIVRKTVADNCFVFYQDGVQVAVHQFDAKWEKRVNATGNVPDGKVLEYYPSGKLLAEWNYKNNMLEGASKLFYESGAVMTVWIYEKDRLEGAQMQFYEQGGIMTALNYHKGKLHGTARMYDEKGNIKSMAEYKNGVLK